MTRLNLHIKLSDLRKFCEFEGFKKVINCIHKIRNRPDLKLFLKVKSDRIRIST